MIEKGFIPKELNNAFNESIILLDKAYHEANIKALKSASKDVDNQR